MGSQTVRYSITADGTGLNGRPATVDIAFTVELGDDERIETVPLPSKLTDSILETARIWGIINPTIRGAKCTPLSRTVTTQLVPDMTSL